MITGWVAKWGSKNRPSSVAAMGQVLWLARRGAVSGQQRVAMARPLHGGLAEQGARPHHCQPSIHMAQELGVNQEARRVQAVVETHLVRSMSLVSLSLLWGRRKFPKEQKVR